MQPITITNSDYRRFSNEIPTYEGRNFTVIEGGLERASLARIELVMHHFLETLSLSMQERYDLVKEANSLFGKYGYRFQKEPLFPLMVEGTSIDVPAHAIIHSTVLDDMMSDYAEITPVISLPTGLTVQEFQLYLGSLPEHTKFKTAEQWFKQRAVADRILYDKKFFENIESNPLECEHPEWGRTLEELKQVLAMLEHNIDLTNANIYASDYLQDYIDASMRTKTLAVVCKELKTIRNYLCNYAITLKWDPPMSVADVIKLGNAIPNVIEFQAQIKNPLIFPSVWQHSLQTLHLYSISSKQTITIAEDVLVNLISLQLDRVCLNDYSVLDNRQQLDKLTLSGIDISKVPTGCSSLQQFSAAYCHMLEDFTALDNHPCLKKCVFSHLELLTKVPKGCLKLEEFTAKSSPIEDFSGLEDLPNLHTYIFTELDHLKQLPTGCNRLRSVSIDQCPALVETSGLSNLIELKECHFESLPLVTRFPTGCRNLKHVFIRSCPLLEDFSGLEGLPHLTGCLFFSLPLITAAPQKCWNLKDFHATNCPKLENFSGLNNLSNLTNCQLHSLPLLTAAPSNCPNLYMLLITQSPELKEISGLKVCHKLKYCTLPLWQPNYKEIYLRSVFPEQKEEDEGTIREMLLKHPVTMTPELERYYKAVTRGCEATSAQLEEILNTIRGTA